LSMTMDPFRAFTAYADKGPSDLKPVIRFFREFMNKTGCALRIAHHDTKPPSNGRDGRNLTQRASGGGIFSIADCPLSFERVGEDKTLVTPSAYEFIEDPKPFQFKLEKAADGSIRLIGEEVEIDGDQKELKDLQTILEAVNQQPGKPMSF